MSNHRHLVTMAIGFNDNELNYTNDNLIRLKQK